MAADRELLMPVTGMTCANCAATVERTLKKTEGVREASVNFASERATVRFACGGCRADERSHKAERAKKSAECGSKYKS